MNRIFLPFLVTILKSLNNTSADRVAVLGRQLVLSVQKAQVVCSMACPNTINAEALNKERN